MSFDDALFSCTIKYSFIMQGSIDLKQHAHVDYEELIKPLFGNHSDRVLLSHDEVWDAVYKDLGHRYGLNDIREAQP